MQNENEKPTEQNANSKVEQVGINTNTTTMSGRYTAGIQNIYNPTGESDIIKCPNCRKEPDENEYGTIKCSKCGTVFCVSSSFSANISSFPNLSSKKNEKYKNIIAHISNCINLGHFDKAYEFCNEAISLSPATPQAWEYKAYCSYFLIDDDEIINTNAEIISRYLLVAKSHYKDEKEIITVNSYKDTSEKISDRIFNMINHKIFLLRARKETDKQKELSRLIYAFRICHRVHPYKALYLEKMLDMFLGYEEDSWISLKMDSSNEKGYKLIDNSHLEGNFFDIINIIFEIIKKIKPDFNLKQFRTKDKNSKLIDVDKLYQIMLTDDLIRHKRASSEFELRIKENNK